MDIAKQRAYDCIIKQGKLSIRHKIDIHDGAYGASTAQSLSEFKGGLLRVKTACCNKDFYIAPENIVIQNHPAADTYDRECEFI